MVDMCHFVGKVSAMGQPTRPTQPSIPSKSVHEIVIHVLAVYYASPWRGKPLCAVAFCADSSVRFEPERTGTPFRFFFFDDRNAVPVLFSLRLQV